MWEWFKRRGAIEMRLMWTLLSPFAAFLGLTATGTSTSLPAHLHLDHGWFPRPELPRAPGQLQLPLYLSDSINYKLVGTTVAV